MHNSNSGKMLGRTHGGRTCTHGHDCGCSGPYRDRYAARTSKRQDSRTWQRDAAREASDYRRMS